MTKREVDDGLVRITATLDPDEAAIVFAAIDARVEDAWRASTRDRMSPPPRSAHLISDRDERTRWWSSPRRDCRPVRMW